jgi:hypothetical protein
MTLDADGQPRNLAFNRARRTERDICELLGLAKGLLADGVVTDNEAALLRDWVDRHPDAYDVWPISALYQRLNRAFADGVIDEAERLDLAELLESLVGGEAGVIAGADAATELPIDRPAPTIIWRASVFVFTGKFAFGPRKDCERQVRPGRRMRAWRHAADELLGRGHLWQPGLGSHLVRAQNRKSRELQAGRSASRRPLGGPLGRIAHVSISRAAA